MSQDPEFYVSLLRDAFKPKNADVPEPTEEKRAVARAAYGLLSECRIIPGGNDAQLDPNLLEPWVLEVRRLAREADRAEIGDEFIGRLLAHAPAEADGVWPHRVVRDLLENIASGHLEIGIEVERFNMRGTTVRAVYGGGEPEHALARQLRESAKAIRLWPRTSAMLDRIAKSWAAMGDEQDERSRKDKLRDV